MSSRTTPWIALVVIVARPEAFSGVGADTSRGRLEIRVSEKAATGKTGESGEREPLPCRVHLADPSGRALQAPGLPFFRDHFNCEGSVDLDLPAGEYRYTIARGPEYGQVSGKVRVEAAEKRRLEVTLERWIDLAARGWWSGETHVHRPLDDIPLLLQSEDLHVASVLEPHRDARRVFEKLLEKAQ